MLKRHQCCINLKKNVLEVHDGQVVVPFLPEGEIKKGFSFSAYKEQLKQQGMDEETATNEAMKASKKPEPQQQQQQSQPTISNKPTPTQPQMGMNQPTSTNPSTQQSGAGFSESSIKKLTDLGFTRDMAIMALRQCQGNEELAASLLFGMTSPF